MSLASVCTGHKKMVDALLAASSDSTPWTGWSSNLAELLLKLLAKRL